MFGGEPQPLPLPWAWAEHRLEQAANYWITTTRADGRPHARPVWGVWLEDRFFLGTGSLAARNLQHSDAITVHLESGDEVVIIEGTAAAVTDDELLDRVIAAFNTKYRYDLDAGALPGPFYGVRPQVAFGWVSDPTGLDRGSAFQGTATRWAF
jgi:hypothetical protein